MIKTRKRAALLFTTGLLLIAAVGCVGDKGVSPSLRAPAGAIGLVHVAPLNAIMAVGDTLSLTVTAQSVTNDWLPSLDSVEYILQNGTDAARVQISASGVITALAPSSANSPILIQVVGFKDGLAKADQVVLQVTATKFTGATLSIQPVPPDSAKLPVGWDKAVIPIIANPTTGERVTGPTLRLEAGPGDSTKLQCYEPYFNDTPTLSSRQLTLSPCGGNNNFGGSFNRILANGKGTAWVVAEATVYGVKLRDSVRFTITNPVQGFVELESTQLSAQELYYSNALVAPGANVYFGNGIDPQIGGQVTYTFDDPSTALPVLNPLFPLSGGTSGNVTALNAGEYAGRQFLLPGVYKYTATVVGGIPPWAGQTYRGQINVEE